MRNRITALAAGIGAAAALVLAGGGVASASVLSPVYNSHEEAGQYIQSHGQIHYRDVRARFTATQAQLAVSNGGSLTGNGGVGIQLCNNSTGYAVQFGLVPDGSHFDLAYQTGDLSQWEPSSTHDACATGGTLPVPVTITKGSGSGHLASYVTVPVGHTVNLELFYNHTSGWVHFIVADAAQGGQESMNVWVGTGRDFAEPGVGVRALNAAGVSAPADIQFVSFSQVRATQYNGTHYGFGAGNPARADNYNKGGSATDAPADLLQAGPLNSAGTAFTVDIGNPTA